MTFSEKLSILRKRKGMSQEQLAEMLDVSRQSVSKWEAQQALPETAKIIMIASIFNVSIDTLLKDDLSIEFDDAVSVVSDTTDEDVAEESAVMYCTQCGKENAIDSMFCGYCGHPFTPLESTPIEEIETPPTTAIATVQPQAISFPAGFDFKRFCANCGSKLGAFRKTRIAGDMHICESCLAQCSNIIVPQIRYKSIADVKNDIARMHQYPEFAPTHQFGNLLFDGNNKLWKAPNYPVFRFQDINDFEVMEERDTQSVSYTHQKTKTMGGLGRALVGGALFGPAGAIVGGVTGKRESVTIGNTHTSDIEYFTKLGVRIMVNDMSVPSISVDFLNGRVLVAKSQRIVDEVNNALGFLNIILKHEI